MFSDLQRARLKPWERAFALRTVEDRLRWRLFERNLWLTFHTARSTANRVDTLSYDRLKNPVYVARPVAGFPSRNVAGDAWVTASSKRAPDFQGDNVVDGFIGYVIKGGGGGCDYCSYQTSEVSEWHTASDDTERWIELTWDSPQRITGVLLSDRSYPTHNVTGYRLEFGSGSPVTGTQLPVRGNFKEHQFLPRESSSLKVVITAHAGSNPGLGEIVVIAQDPDFKGHLTAPRGH